MDHQAVYKKLLSEFDQHSECCVCTDPGDLVLFGCDEHGVCVKCFHSMVNAETARMLAEWPTHSMPITTIRCPMCRDAINVKANLTEKLRFQPLQTHRLADNCKQVLHEALGVPAPVKTARCGLCQDNFDDVKSFREHAQRCILMKPCMHLNCTKRTLKPFCEEHTAPPVVFRIPHVDPAPLSANPSTGTILRGGNTHTRFGAAYVMEHGFAARHRNRPSTPVTAVADDTALFGQVGPIPPAGDGLSANAVMTPIDPATNQATFMSSLQPFIDMTPQQLGALYTQAFNLTNRPVRVRDVQPSDSVEEALSPAFVAADPDGGGSSATVSTLSVSDPNQEATGVVNRPARQITGWTERVLGVLDRLLTYNGMYRQITTIHGVHNITLDGRNPPAVYRRDDALAFLPRNSPGRAGFNTWCTNDHPVDNFSWKALCRHLSFPRFCRARDVGLDGRAEQDRALVPTVAHLFVHPFPDQVVSPVATLLSEPSTIDTIHGLQHLQHARAAAAIIYHNYATLAIVSSRPPEILSTFNGLCRLERVNEYDWEEACGLLRLPTDEQVSGFQHLRQLDAEQFFACLTS